MSRERDERMWNLAYCLARSGEHRNYQAIEWELRAFGYSRARQLLHRERVRERLDGMCAEAQKGFVGDEVSVPRNRFCNIGDEEDRCRRVQRDACPPRISSR